MDDPAARDQTYRNLTIELTGSAPIGSPRSATDPPRRLSSVQSKHRARIQRRAILDTLLDRSAVEIDADKLEAFLGPVPDSPVSPLPPAVGAPVAAPATKAAS